MYQDNLVLYFICVHYCLRKKADNFVVKAITWRAIISRKFYFETSECRVGALGKLKIRLFTNFIVCSYHCPFPDSKSPWESERFIHREKKGIARFFTYALRDTSNKYHLEVTVEECNTQEFQNWTRTLSLPATCVWLWARWLILQHIVIYTQ